MPQKKTLLVLTSHDDLGGVRKTGFHLGEAAHPWKELTDAGVHVDIASIAGGAAPVDGRKDDDPIQTEFLAAFADELQNTPKLGDLSASDYDAVVFVGGHGTMWDFPNNDTVASLGRDIYENGGVVAAVCHGPAALVGMTLSDGTPLVQGKTLAAFTDAEEEAVGLTDVVPFLLQTELEKLGATHTSAENFTENVEVSERLVTGQNPASARRLGAEIAKLLTV